MYLRALENCGATDAMADVDGPILLNDFELAQMALKDPRAEDALFRRVYPKIFRIVRFAVGGRKQADDIAQLAALQVLKSLDSFGGLGSLDAWAERIAYRTAMRLMKREHKKNKMYFSLTDMDIPHRETPEKAVSRRQQFESMLSKMECIPAKRRIPLLLHLGYGYTVSEVSALTEASPNTVKARLRVAFRELRVILEEHPSLRASMLEDTP